MQDLGLNTLLSQHLVDGDKRYHILGDLVNTDSFLDKQVNYLGKNYPSLYSFDAKYLVYCFTFTDLSSFCRLSECQTTL